MGPRRTGWWYYAGGAFDLKPGFSAILYLLLMPFVLTFKEKPAAWAGSLLKKKINQPKYCWRGPAAAQTTDAFSFILSYTLAGKTVLSPQFLLLYKVTVKRPMPEQLHHITFPSQEVLRHGQFPAAQRFVIKPVSAFGESRFKGYIKQAALFAAGKGASILTWRLATFMVLLTLSIGRSRISASSSALGSRSYCCSSLLYAFIYFVKRTHRCREAGAQYGFVRPRPEECFDGSTKQHSPRILKPRVSPNGAQLY